MSADANACSDVLIDLALRFGRARRAALEAVTGALATADGDEAWQVRLATSVAKEALLRRVYDHALTLGRGFVRYHGGTPVSAEALPALLGALDCPCVGGDWTATDGGLVHERPGCEHGVGGPALCDYWREAIGGLVHGLTDGVLHARHASVGRGQSSCRDALYDEPEGPLRYGPVPASTLAAVDAAKVAAHLLAPDVRVRVFGVLEDELCVGLEQNGCDPDADAQRQHVLSLFHRYLPGLTLRDVSPRAVLAAEGAAA